MTDTLDVLEALTGLLLATSLASERFVTILKTIFPWLAVEKMTDALAVDLSADKARRIAVLCLALLGSYLTVGLLFGIWNPLKDVVIGTASYPTGLIAFLGSSGSAFWTGVVGYVKAVKDTKEAEKIAVRLGAFNMANTLKITATKIEAQGKRQ